MAWLIKLVVVIVGFITMAVLTDKAATYDEQLVACVLFSSWSFMLVSIVTSIVG